MNNWQKQTQIARAVSLETVAARLGYHRDTKDQKRWKRQDSIISINGSQFYDHIAEIGGGGAIDLVLHAQKCSFHETIQFLHHTDHECPWTQVHNYLVNKRGINPKLINQCQNIGVIKADKKANAVFICRNANKQKTGAELVGTQTNKPFKGMILGSQKSEGSFWIGRRKNPKQALLTESAIDALSAWTLVNPKQIDIIVSTAGATQNLPKWMLKLKLNIIYCGFDADKAGEQAAQSMIAKYTNIQRLKPENAKDWNEILLGKN